MVNVHQNHVCVHVCMCTRVCVCMHEKIQLPEPPHGGMHRDDAPALLFEAAVVVWVAGHPSRGAGAGLARVSVVRGPCHPLPRLTACAVTGTIVPQTRRAEFTAACGAARRSAFPAWTIPCATAPLVTPPPATPWLPLSGLTSALGTALGWWGGRRVPRWLPHTHGVWRCEHVAFPGVCVFLDVLWLS